MTKEDLNRGSIGKYYRDKYPIHHYKNQEIQIDDSDISYVADSELDKYTSYQEKSFETMFESQSDFNITQQLSTQSEATQDKKKLSTKPSSVPRKRRRSRRERSVKPKKQNTKKNLGGGTTIIVIQKDDQSEGSYKTKELQDFNGLEKEIRKIRNDSEGKGRSKTHYKSENRATKQSRVNNQVFGYQEPQNGKPPLKSPSNKNMYKVSNIPRLGERRNSSKANADSKPRKQGTNTYINKSTNRVGSTDSQQLRNKIRKNKMAAKSKFAQKKKEEEEPESDIDNLIQKKKDALGIKPLESSLKNYQAVVNENARLKKLVEEQKKRIKTMRQERVEQVKALNSHKENEKKLEHIIKHETPDRTRKNRSGYRKKSRENSNASATGKDIAKSPHTRYGSE